MDRSVEKNIKPIVIATDRNVHGTKYVKEFQFKSGHKVPIYGVLDCHGLNQIIGYDNHSSKSSIAFDFFAPACTTCNKF